MGKLGDLFPEPEKRKYVEGHLKPGQVLYLFSGFTNPPKEKFLVLVCPSANPLLFCINSRIHPFIADRPDLMGCQVQLYAVDYDFLDHDSFVDCSEVIEFFTEEQIKGQLFNDIGRIKGELTAATKSTMIGVIQNARTVSSHQKRLIITALS